MNRLICYNLGRELLAKYGLSDWAFKFHKDRPEIGLCSHARKTISLCGDLVDQIDLALLPEVILHEVAHALVGAEHGHDALWKAKAVELGADADGRFLFRPPPEVEIARPIGEWMD